MAFGLLGCVLVNFKVIPSGLLGLILLVTIYSGLFLILHFRSASYSRIKLLQQINQFETAGYDGENESDSDAHVDAWYNGMETGLTLLGDSESENEKDEQLYTSDREYRKRFDIGRAAAQKVYALKLEHRRMFERECQG